MAPVHTATQFSQVCTACTRVQCPVRYVTGPSPRQKCEGERKCKNLEISQSETIRSFQINIINLFINLADAVLERDKMLDQVLLQNCNMSALAEKDDQ